MPLQQSITFGSYFYTEALLQAKKKNLTHTAQQLGAEVGSIDELRGKQPAFPLICKHRSELLQSALPWTQEINILQVNEIDPLTSASD